MQQQIVFRNVILGSFDYLGTYVQKYARQLK
jgi:hypothetical protein